MVAAVNRSLKTFLSDLSPFVKLKTQKRKKRKQVVVKSFSGLARFSILHYLFEENEIQYLLFLFCQRLIVTTLRIHYGNEDLLVNL